MSGEYDGFVKDMIIWFFVIPTIALLIWGILMAMIFAGVLWV